jgi:hypothetical protein
LRPSLRQVWAARSRIDILSRLLGGTERLVLLLTGPGLHSAKEIESALGAAVAGRLAADSRTAAALSDGAGGRRRLEAGQLIKSAGKVGEALRGRCQLGVSLTAEA